MIIGHEKIIQELKQLADSKRLTHSYLFLGPQYVGKKEVALGFAHYLEFGDFGKGKGASAILGDCLLIQSDGSASIGIDAIREMKNFLWQTPNQSSYRTVLVNDSEFLTPEAQNALLKITEEPPRDSLVILIAKDAESLQSTLASRLSRIYFSPVRNDILKDWLMKERKIAEKEAALLTEESAGCPGLALRLYEDEDFKKLIDAARKYLSLRDSSSRNEFVKEILKEELPFVKFLDALIFVVALEIREGRKATGFWHRLLSLRRNAAYFNLNPRIQLENLFAAS